MFELKEYQKETLGILREYLEQASLQGPKAAFGKVTAKHPSDVRPSAYHARWGMDNVPYVCLRLPTGGGKRCLPRTAWESLQKPVFTGSILLFSGSCPPTPYGNRQYRRCGTLRIPAGKH